MPPTPQDVDLQSYPSGLHSPWLPPPFSGPLLLPRLWPPSLQSGASQQPPLTTTHP